MYYEVPSGSRNNILARCFLVGINANIAQSVIKYLSLTFTAVIKNMAPIAVIFLSAYFLKTKIQGADIIFCVVCLGACSLVVVGYG